MEEHDDLVKEFILMCQNKGLSVSSRLIIEVARKKGIELGRVDLKCSNGWLEKFKLRTNLKDSW